MAFLSLLILALATSIYAVPLSTTTTISNTNEISPRAPWGIWHPSPGTTWQIVLSQPLTDISSPVDVFDIDLFDNPSSTIDEIHNSNRRVICYFSAGTYENWREDASSFHWYDKGDPLNNWYGENWVDIRSQSVRAIMTERMNLAREKGCDGIDPDNVDAYGNDNGLGLTEDDAADYLNWLAGEAHYRGMAIGLKNAGGIIPKVISRMQYVITESCVMYDECDIYNPFLRQGKAVFHIEYPSLHSASGRQEPVCQGIQGFSTVMKTMDLSTWVQTC